MPSPLYVCVCVCVCVCVFALSLSFLCAFSLVMFGLLLIELLCQRG